MRMESWSPNGEHQLLLHWAGEIRFGPHYFHAIVTRGSGGQLDLGGRVFGDRMLWSDDSRYLVLQEWDSTTEADGPRTRLLVLDLLSNSEHHLTPTTGGWVEPAGFEGHILRIDRHQPGGILHTEVDLGVLARWQPL
jgi:hypothetical protein